MFSHPPYDSLRINQTVYFSLCSIYAFCAFTLIVGCNFDSHETRRRVARGIVPRELIPVGFGRCSWLVPQYSVPSEVSEQYYIDEKLLQSRSADSLARRLEKRSLLGYLWWYVTQFPEVVSKEHLALSVLVSAIPAFSRLKRCFLIVLHLHICMLAGALLINYRENRNPYGVYEVFSCKPGGEDCMTTVPLAVAAAAAFVPAFRILFRTPLRLTCLVPLGHPCTSQFPLGPRKFAATPGRSAWDVLLCRRTPREQEVRRVELQRSLARRVLRLLWRATLPSVNCRHFYGVALSWLVLLFQVALAAAAALYVLTFTLYLEDAAVYHWLVWTITMHFSAILLIEPLWIFSIEVIWRAVVADVAQHWGIGDHALASSTRYRRVVEEVELRVLRKLRVAGAIRIQRWWAAVLEMHIAIHQQNAVAIKVQARVRRNAQLTRYIKERKWCLKVDVLDATDLHIVTPNGLQSPLVCLQCEGVNPRTMTTKVSWNTGSCGTFNETFLIDILDSRSLYVSVWSKDVNREDFIGRGCFDFDGLRSGRKGSTDTHLLRVDLFDIQHGQPLPHEGKPLGHVKLRVHFLDPLVDACGEDGQTDWMLPSNRMQFSQAKHGEGGRLDAARLLGTLVPASETVATETAGKEMSGPAEALQNLPYRRFSAIVEGPDAAALTPHPDMAPLVGAEPSSGGRLAGRRALQSIIAMGPVPEAAAEEPPGGEWRPSGAGPTEGGGALAGEEGDEDNSRLRVRAGAAGPWTSASEPVVTEEDIQDDFIAELHAEPFEAQLPAPAPELKRAIGGAWTASGAAPRQSQGSLPRWDPPAAPPPLREPEQSEAHTVQDLSIGPRHSLNFEASGAALVPGSIASPREGGGAAEARGSQEG
mmetsp:Transcript_44880/g.120152  ORF Transcript_44880/g.120152 Transcript_44880/m.120152 type:complete len:872 (+) Transcript_44880:42-2657(+)